MWGRAAELDATPGAAPKAGRDVREAETRPEAVREDVKESRHTVRIGGKTVDYTARAGILQLKDDEGKPRAGFFFAAYERPGDKGKDGPESRPVTFAFNGGPGSSSMWLHLGALGPRRLVLTDRGEPLPPPVRLEDNEWSWLDFTDLVFVDPVGTGYSRPASPDKAKEFYSVQGDVESVGDFIRLYLTRYGRWTSPKFLVGESYGTTRAAGLSGYLHDAHGIDLNGLVLISPALDLSTIAMGAANDLSLVLSLPSYAVAAWYHGKAGQAGPGGEAGQAGAPADPLAVMDQAKAWALDTYAALLARGSRLDPEARKESVRRLAALAGLSEGYLDLSDLRVPESRFRKELLRDRRLVIGRMDTRLTGYDGDPAGSSAGLDPLFDSLIGPFTAAVNATVAGELQFGRDIDYKYLNYQANRAWDWSTAVQGKQGYANVADTLATAMAKNRYLKVLVACGVYDLATPCGSAEYTLDHLDLSAELRRNITLKRYEAGHIVYVDKAALQRLTEDARNFYRDALPAEGK
jgi:carboxypeptidase C (cathepsin A)